MDIREVTQALRDATECVEKSKQAIDILIKQNSDLTKEVARLKLEIYYWEDTYGPEAPSV